MHQNLLFKFNSLPAFNAYRRNENSSLRQERQNPQEAPDPLLAPHGILYHHVGEVREEIAQNRTHRPVAVKWEALYPGQLINDYNMVDFFKLMFPMQKIQQMLSLTNRNMKRAAETDKDHKYHPMDEAEFFRYIGIRLMIVRLKASTVKEYWEELQHEDSIHPPYNFRKRFGMPRWRFELIEKCLQWDLFDPVSCLMCIVAAYQLCYDYDEKITNSHYTF